jgi:hypothetical protein
MNTPSVISTEARATKPYGEFITEHEVKEAIVVVGPMSRSQEVLRALYDDGWRCQRTGPYTDKKLWPKVDPERFLFTAERAIDEQAKSPKRKPRASKRARRAT